MWPFSEMSLSVATLVGSIANWVLLASLVGGVASTFIIVKTTDVKEHYWDLAREEAAKKISELNAETERLRSDNLNLYRSLLPRSILFGSRDGDEKIRSERFEKIKAFSGTPVVVHVVPDLEAQILAANIAMRLKEAGWIPSVSPIGGGVITNGVVVSTLEEWPLDADFNMKPSLPKPSKTRPAAEAAVSLLELDLGPPYGPSYFGVHFWSEYAGRKSIWGPELQEDTVHIFVGLRPVPPPTVPAAKPEPSK
jgi:hypothetical protein